jgi:hypothetical protein
LLGSTLERPIGMIEITPELAASIVRRYYAGQGIQLISFGTDVSRARIRQVLVDAGVPIRRASEMKRYNQRFIARKKLS